MEVFKTEDLQHLWALIQGAPVASLTLLLAVVAASAIASWFLRGQLADSKIAGLETQLEVRDDRLKLANERAQAQIAAREEVVSRFNELKAQARPDDRTASRLAALEKALTQARLASQNLESAVIYGEARISEQADSATFEATVR